MTGFEDVPDEELAGWHPENPLRWQVSSELVELDHLVGIDQAAETVADDDPELAQPGAMRAVWWSKCKACENTILERDVQVLAEIPDVGRAWVHPECVPEINEAEVEP
jgi:hypothetical protein